MNPNLTKGDPVSDLELDPDVRKAIENARAKIKNRAHMQSAALKSDLTMILDDFCTTHGIVTIDGYPPNDSVRPSSVLDSLCAKLAERMAESDFRKFLAEFTAGLLEHDQMDQRRNQ